MRSRNFWAGACAGDSASSAVLDVDIKVRRGAFALSVRFSAPTPGVTALFGASGAGKTSLALALAGLLTPDAGRLALDGECWFDPARGIDVPAERRRIGYVFQDARLFPHLDVAGNLGYGAARARPLTRYADRDEVIALLGLGALLGRRVHGLSGGERQRVALGRALLAQPALLLLDEPLAAMDVARREEVLPYLETLRDRYAIPMLYVSHQYDEVLRLANYIVLMADGAVAASGTPSELGSHPRLQALIGAEAVGAVIDATVTSVGPAAGLAEVTIGAARMKLSIPGAAAGAKVRLNVLARDVILAIRPPEGLSVRNAFAGHLLELKAEAADSVLATVAIDGTRILARISPAAVEELHLAPGMAVWALVKAASLRPRAYQRADAESLPP